MPTAAIIQARTGSTRLPRKVLCDIGGRSMLARVVERTRRATLVDSVVVATTVEPDDQAIVDECEALGVPCTRGSLLDVLDRYVRAAESVAATTVVRITSDCPLIDPEIIDRTVRHFFEAGVDYASESLANAYPRGLDTEVVSSAALARAWREAALPYERVHVTPYFYRHPELFRVLAVPGEGDYSKHRWTVDTPEDLELVRTIYDRLGHAGRFSWRDVLRLVEREPQLSDINRHIQQKAVEEG